MSDDLRPPSLRDTTRLEDVVRHHGLVLSKLAPGLFGGRSRIPDPLDFADDLAADGDPGNDGDTDEPEWWDEDRYTATGAGVITWTLTYAPVPESLSITWCGVSLIRPEDFTLGDDGQTVTIPDQGFHDQDLFAAQYQFLDVINDDPVPGSAIFVGGRAIGDNATSIALPTGTQPGNLLVLAMGTGGLAGSVPTVTDSRIVASYTQDHQVVAYGYADSSTDPLTISISDSEGNGRVVLAAYDVAGTPVVAHSQGASNLSPTLPAGSFDAGVAVVSYQIDVGLTSPQGDWIRDEADNGSSQFQEAWSNSVACGAFASLTTNEWTAIVIGFEEG